MARAEGRRLRRAVSRDDLFPVFRVDFVETAGFFVPDFDVVIELDFEVADLLGVAVESEACAAAKETSSHAASAARRTRARPNVAKNDRKHFIAPL